MPDHQPPDSPDRSPAAPAALRDQRALRGRLVELHGAVMAYFEATGVEMTGNLWAAFDALRKNQPLAEAFVADLKILLEAIEFEIIPALSGQASQQAPVQQAPQAAQPPQASQAPGRPINNDETMLFSKLPPGFGMPPPVPPKPAPPVPQTSGKPEPTKLRPAARSGSPLAARIAAVAPVGRPAAANAGADGAKGTTRAKPQGAGTKVQSAPHPRQAPQFDESDLTNPGFTLDVDFTTKKR